MIVSKNLEIIFTIKIGLIVYQMIEILLNGKRMLMIILIQLDLSFLVRIDYIVENLY